MEPKNKLFLVVVLVWSMPWTSIGAKSADNETHTVSEQISEGLNLAGGVRAAVSEFYYSQNRFPVDNAEAGLAEPFDIKGRYVVSVAVTASGGIISIEFGGDASPEIFGQTIEYIPALDGSSVKWTCSSEYIPEMYWPQSCR